MSWFNKISQTELSESEHYFSIGHGDYSEEYGEPDYIVWVYLHGDIQTEEDTTHGMSWGHEQCDRTYKGRYEPDTGRLSVVKPCGKEKQSVPLSVMQRLEEEFSHITEVHEF